MISVRAEVFGALALIPLALNWYAARRQHAPAAAGLATSAMVLAIWGVTTHLERSLPPPEAYFFHWVLDLTAMITCAWLARVQKLRFAAFLAVMFAFQIAANASYLWATAPGNALMSGIAHSANGVDYTTYRYMFAINVAFIAICFANSVPGGGYVARDLRAWGSRRGRFHPSVDAGR